MLDVEMQIVQQYSESLWGSLAVCCDQNLT